MEWNLGQNPIIHVAKMLSASLHHAFYNNVAAFLQSAFFDFAYNQMSF